MNPTSHMRRRTLQWLFGAVTAGALLFRIRGGTAATVPLHLQPSRTIVWKDFLGLNAQFMLYTPDVRTRQVEALKRLGLQWVRAGLHWMLLEPEQGRWSFGLADAALEPVRDQGLHAVAAVVGTPRYASSAPAGSPYVDKFPPTSPELFAKALVTLVERYPQVEAWQIWNEPNIPGFWFPKSDPDGYARLLAASVQAVRAVAPQKTLAMAGMAYYSQMYGRDGLMLEAMGNLGAFGLDLVAAYHPYTPVAEGTDIATRDFVQRVSLINTWLRAAHAKQIWATEWGWSSYAGPVEEQPLVGEAGQALETLKRLALMAALDFDRVFLFTLADIDARAGRRDRRYGLLTESGDPKPVYRALANFLAVTGPQLEPDSPPRVADDARQALVSIGWKRGDGSRLWMFWSDEATSVTLPDVAHATLHDPITGERREIVAQRGGLVVPATTQLQLLAFR